MPAEGAIHETVIELLFVALLWVIAACNNIIVVHLTCILWVLESSDYISVCAQICLYFMLQVWSSKCHASILLCWSKFHQNCQTLYRHTKPKHIRWITLGGRHELSLAPLGGSTKAPTRESSATSLPWIKKPLKVGLLPAAERVTIEVKKEMWRPHTHIEPTDIFTFSFRCKFTVRNIQLSW